MTNIFKYAQKSDFISLHYSNAKKILVMNQKGGVGKTTLVAGLISYLNNQNFNVELIDFDKQKSAYDWYKHINEHSAHEFNPSYKSLTSISSALKVHRNTQFVIIDSPSNFSREDMMRYTYFANGIIIPMSPSPVDLLASLPFIESIIDSGILRYKKIPLSFVINRCFPTDLRIDRVEDLLKNFRQFPTLGKLSEHSQYQEAFFTREKLDTSVDAMSWQNIQMWLSQI